MLVAIVVCIAACALPLASTQTCSGVTVNIASSPHMPNGVVNIGELPNVILFCTPDDRDPYTWQFNETTVPSVTNDKWNIIAPQPGDYRCGFDANGCGIVYSSKIIFAIPPTVKPIPNISVNESSNFQLLCEVTGGYPTPNVTWYKDTQPVGTGVSYMISSSSPSDGGNYTCVASNAVGNASKSLIVEIISPPTAPTITSSSVLPDMSSLTLIPSSSPDVPRLTNGEIVGVSVISFLGLAFIISLIFLISAFFYFIHFIRQRKTRNSVNKSKLIENEHVPSNKEPDFNATIPTSPSCINEGFKADDDSASSQESEKVDTKAVAAKEVSAAKEEPMKKTEETIEVEEKARKKSENEVVDEKKEVEVEPEEKAKGDQDVFEAIEKQLVEVVVEIEDAMKQQETETKEGDRSNMTSIQLKAAVPKEIEMPPNSSPLTPVQLRELMESVDLLALQRKDTNNPFKSDYEAIPTNAPDRDAWPAGTMAKNRYLSVIPSPHSAVTLTSTGDDLSTYINANFINGYEGKDKAYIATQAPTYDTIPDFWRMIWEQKVTTIVMTCGIVEGGRNKCAKYWPPAEDNDTQTYGNVVVRNNFEETTPHYKITYLTIYPSSSVDDPSVERDVYHFWFTAWPETGVPMEPTSTLKFREAVLSSRNVSQSGPIVVHCSGGLGRTGVFILSDILIQEYEKKGTIHPLRWLAELRRARGGIIQSMEQYIFVHRILMAYVNEHPK